MNSHTRLCLSVLIVSATFCLYAASAGSQSGAPRRITTTAEHSLNLNPTLSGDGRVVAFESTADLSDTAGPAGFRFLRANLAGGDALRFTQLASSRAPAPAMSQDGARLAFASRADLSGANRDGNFEIFFHDGARLRQVTDTTPETPAQAAVEGNFQPSISDDGGLLAFASNRDLTGANRDGNSEIFLYDTRLGSFRQLTDSVGVFGASGAKLSGDGTHVAFVQDNGTQAGGPSETRDLVLLEIASGIVRVLAVNVNQLGLTHGRAISDDGARVVYSTISDAGERQILFSDGRNGVVRQITSLADAARDVPPHPTISGDGARIAFATKRNVNGMNPDRSVELYLYDIPTNQLSLITNAPREADAEIVSSLSDDGSIIAFNFPRVLSGSVTSLEFNDNSEIYALDLPARVPFSTALHATHAATFGGEPAAIKTLAPGQIAVATGTNLALVTAQTVRGVGGAFPRSQANVQLFVNNRPAQLFFVSPTQFNFQVPPETEIGVAEFAVRNHDGYVSRTPVNVSASAPGVFTETGDGAGAAVALESQTFLRLPFDPVGPNGELRRLTIFGTGLRGAARVEVEVGGRPLAVERIVASPDLPGLDEIHVRLRHELAGAGVVPLVVRADGRDSNPTTLEFGGTRRPASIILTPLTARIGVGRKARFAATVLDIEGLVIPDAPVAFSSTEAGVAQVNSAGEAVGLRAGNTSIAAASGPTVTRAALEVYPLTLVLNEALADPPDGSAGDANQDGVRSASQDEFVEIVNASEADLDLGGYSILTRNSSGSDTLRHAFAPETILAPGASVVVFGSAQAATFDPSHPAFGGALVLTASTGGLSLLNGGSTITLADPSGQTIEHLTYGGSMGLEGDRDQSLTRAPDIGGEFAPHLNAGGADLRRFSPGAHLDGTPFEITVPLARLEIEPVAASIVTGDRQQFDARAFAADGREIPGVIFRWTTGDASLASVNSQGLVHGLSVGVTTITATARNVRAVAALTVREPPPVLQRIELSPSSAIVLVGNEQQFTARGFDQFNRVMTEVELSFATSDASTASIVGVMAAPSTGVATATLRGLRAGEARITASAPGAGTATVTSNAAVLRVNEPPRVIQRLDIEPVAGFALNRGGTRQLTARAYDQNNQVVLGVVFDWSTNTPHVATIDQAGLCRAVGVGQTTITVSASNGAGGSISAQVTLTAVAPLVINEIHADVAPDDPATAAVEGDANRDGVRSADDDEFVELLNNSDAPLELSGIVLADATSNRFTFPANTALEAGRAVVIFGGGAALATDETIFGGALVFKASSLGLNDGGDTLNVKLPQGGGETLIAAQSYGPGMPPLPAAPANQSLTRAPDAEVGAGGGEFNAHTTATNSDGRRFSPGTRIDGTPFGSPAITRIELTPAAATVERGATQSFAARAFASVEGGEVEVSQVSFAWESSDPSRATVAPLAGATTVAATSTAGSITIRARAGGRQGIAALAINPLPPVLTRVELVPSIAAVFAGDTQHFTARAFDQYGHPFGGAAFTFTSHDTHIATVDSVAGQPGEGVAVASVTGRSTGSARITATAQIASTTVVSNDATLNVNPRPRMLTRIEVSPASASVQVGATQQFTARGFDQDNVEIPGLSFSWSASDANVAVIGQTGLATGLRAGTVSVTASVNEIAGRAALTIEPPAVPAAGQVIINEALVAFSNTSTQARADFVELYNPTAQTLDISGLRISFRPAGSGNAARSVTLPGAHGSHPTLIRPFGYFLVINGAQTFGAGIETVNGITDGFNASSANFDLNNTTGGIELELNGVKLDGLTYQGGSTAPADLFRTYGEGSLLIFTGGATNDLIRTPNAADTDHNATDFRRNGATANVTPKAPNPQIQ